MIFLFRKRKQRSVGSFGEDTAADYLRKKGYKILEKNYRAGKNEIDLIVEKDGFVAFVEVKTRSQSSKEPSVWGRPVQAVDRHKRHCLASAARCYAKRGKPGLRFRFDVVEVYLTDDKRVEHIHHMENAFYAEPKYHFS